MAEEECDRLRALLRLSPEPSTPDGRQVYYRFSDATKPAAIAFFQDAGVLILLDGTPDDYRVFLCIRSEHMRRHPGEVCFPGGMRDNGENMQETAMREAEEVSIREANFLRRDKFVRLQQKENLERRKNAKISVEIPWLDVVNCRYPKMTLSR